MNVEMNKSAYDCQGCSLCLLSCPMWLQQRDVGFSPQGVFKALQAGAGLAEIQPALDMCVDCGACDVLCPENIQIGHVFAEFREDLAIASEKILENDGKEGFGYLFDVEVRKRIKETDFYVISASEFHKNHASRVEFYTAMQQETGCSLNLDLQRNAIVTGIGTALDETQQIAWLVQGRRFERIIVENESDIKALSSQIDKPVLHVSQLL